jgi:hypothetical protein
MKIPFFALLVSGLVAGMGAAPAKAERLRFSGYDFIIKQGAGMGPGPNDWATSQAFVDSKGRLHLRYSERKGKWLAGEITSVSTFGFGTYEIEFEGDIGGLDRNVVFGFFNYPTSDVGPDGTHEIDIEFARWGDQSYPPLNYTIWPVDPAIKPAHKAFGFGARITSSIHRFRWQKDRIGFNSVEVKDNGHTGKEVTWVFKPSNPQKRISSAAMPLHFNLWGFRGQEPADGKPVEVIINRFTFTPDP